MKTVIVCLSFGDGTQNHGASNAAIADKAVECANLYRMDVIAQWEVAENIAQKEVKGLKIFPVWSNSMSKYLTTREVLKGVREILHEEGYDAALIIAHPNHIFRVRMTARQEGIKIEKRPYSGSIVIPFDAQSTQPWTRSKARFLPREWVATILTIRRWI